MFVCSVFSQELLSQVKVEKCKVSAPSRVLCISTAVALTLLGHQSNAIHKMYSFACVLKKKEKKKKKKRTMKSWWWWLPWWLSHKESVCQCRKRRFSFWVGKIPWRSKWLPIPVFLPGEFHGQSSLVGYRPQGHKSQTRLTKPHTSTRVLKNERKEKEQN